MAMRERTRRWAIRAAWAVLLVAGTLLVGLRIGRPLYYTDGLQQVEARDLAAAGMVRWGTPEVIGELPGPVVGRVAVLPDGRLLYGRTTADGTTDLVLFDLARPAVPPEPAYGLNTGHNELAPAVAADGRVYFASDRPGTGGYDLYESRLTDAGFAAPAPVVLCNTARDETDPAPHRNGSDFVFVRIDRQVDEGRGGTLFWCRLGETTDPTPVFPTTAGKRTAPADRDPAFASDGGALWFVRKERGEPLRVVRSSRLDGVFDEPRVVSAAWATGEVRAPLPSPDGLRLGVLHPAKPGDGGIDLWYQSAASELYPWWPGQHWLELLLLSAIGVCALLLVLLHLGRRWSTIDFVTQCLLLSLLLHVLLFLWLWGKEISGAVIPGDADDGVMQVSVVAPQASASTANAEGPRGEEVAARVAFAPAERTLAADAPGAAPERANDAPLDAPAAEHAEAADARQIEAATAVQDQAATLAQRTGADATPATTAAEVAAVQESRSAAAAAAEADKTAPAPVPVTAGSPDPAVDRAALAARLVAGASAPLAPPAADPEGAAADAPTLRDTGSAAAVLENVRADADAAATPLAATEATIVPAAAAGSTAQRAASAVRASELARAPQAAVQRTTAALPGPTATERVSVQTPQPERSPAAAQLREVAAVAVPTRTAVAAETARLRQADGPALEQVASNPAAMARADATATTVPRAGADIVVPRAELPAATGRVSATAPLRPPVASVGRRADDVPLATPRDGAAVAAPHSASAAARGDSPTASVPAPVATAVNPTAAAGPASRRAAAIGAAPEVVTAPTAAPERNGAGLRAPIAGPLPAQRRAASGPGALAAVTLREGGTTPAARAAAAPASTNEARAPFVGALRVTGPIAAAGAAPAPAARDQGALPEPTPVIDPPATQLARAGASVAAPTHRNAPVVVAGPRAQPRSAALRDGAPTNATTDTKSPAPSHAAVVLAPPSLPAPQPFASALDAPRRIATKTGPPIPAERVIPPGALLERTASAPLGPGSVEPVAGTAYSNRFGPAKAKAIEQFGGTADTERAVAAGLRYLASIQSADGTWGDRDQFDAKYGSVYVGKTALCVLAFLGAGHTPSSRTEHSAVVARAIDHLLSLQEEDTGAFGASSCYGHGIATYALAECYGITKAARLRRPIEEALTWILSNQGPRRDKRNRGGWGYFSPGLQREDDYARVSVSAWMIMALESARLSGIELPTEVLPRAREFLELSFDQQNGWFRYNHKPSRLNSAWPTLPASTPAGAFCLMLLGAGADDPKVAAAVDYTVERRPEQYRRYDDDDFVLRGQGNVYFWYYGTLCSFLAGGEAWERWNERLRILLPAAQAQDGSFLPIDTYAREAGDNRRDRSYTTAMCVLSLEIYYRYFTPLLVGR